MEVGGSGGGAGHDATHTHWWWAFGSAAQLGCGISAVRRGCNGRLMPLKALGVASLFVGAIAAASMGTLRACNIYKVEDMKEMGENIRTSIGAPPRNNTR